MPGAGSRLRPVALRLRADSASGQVARGLA
jgi:hypothetical protein